MDTAIITHNTFRHCRVRFYTFVGESSKTFDDVIVCIFGFAPGRYHATLYSCVLSYLAYACKRGWSWPCFHTNLSAFLM